MTTHRIAAGAVVEREDGRLLPVRHHRPGRYDVWVAPGGGAEGEEDLLATVRRAVREEAGLQVEPLKLACVEDLANPFSHPPTRACKLWFTARLLGGSIDTSQREATRAHIVEAGWLSREEMRGLTVFPPMRADADWQDRARGFDAPRYLPLRWMGFG